MNQPNETTQEVLTPKQELGLGVIGVLGGAAIIFAGVKVNAPIETVSGLVTTGIGAHLAGKAVARLHSRSDDNSNSNTQV